MKHCQSCRAEMPSKRKNWECWKCLAHSPLDAKGARIIYNAALESINETHTGSTRRKLRRIERKKWSRRLRLPNEYRLRTIPTKTKYRVTLV